MKKIVIFLMLIFGMNVMALFVPCAKGDIKCVIRSFKINGEVINKDGSQDIEYIVHLLIILQKMDQLKLLDMQILVEQKGII